MTCSPGKALECHTTAHCGTNISAGKASIFFTLPAELRLEVYKHLLEDCLETGFSADVAGLFFCCRRIYQEIKSEFMTIVKPLLTAKHDWETSDSCDGKLSMQVLPEITSREAELSIIMPIRPVFNGKNCCMSSNDMTGGAERRFSDATFLLRDIFARKWSTLTLNLDNRTDLPMNWAQIDNVYSNFFLVRGTDGKNHLDRLKHIDRLVLYYDDPSMRLARWAVHVPTWYRLDSILRRGGGPRTVRRGWLTPGGKRSGWRLTIDFEEHLEPVKGAMCRLTHVDRQPGMDNQISVKYNPLGDVSTEVLNECYYASSESDGNTEEMNMLTRMMRRAQKMQCTKITSSWNREGWRLRRQK